MIALYSSDPACWSWLAPSSVDHDKPWEALTAWQAGRCAACGADEVELVNDHDHYTGLRRGQLCRSCNVHEGFCSDSSCRCAKYRRRPPVAMLEIEVEHGGWWAVTSWHETAAETTARAARIRDRHRVAAPSPAPEAITRVPRRSRGPAGPESLEQAAARVARIRARRTTL